MMARLPRVTAAQVVKVLEQEGFALVRQSGSHRIYRNRADRRVAVPYHSGKVLHPKVLKAIRQDMDLSVEEFLERLS